MKSPSWLQGYVESLDIQPLGRYRSDCPVCGKKNTFSVNDDGMQRLWFCFHADCNVSGRTGVALTRDFAKLVMKKQEPKILKDTLTKFELPDTFVSLSRSLDAELYLKSVNAYDAYLAGRADIRYDFKRNRVAYIVKQGNNVVDAAGRAIDNRNPKWYRYGSSSLPFYCGSSRTAIVLEDCASACAASELVTGVALLGTNLLEEHINTLKNYERIFVALDKDATDKAVGMVKVLCRHVPTKLMVLHRDLKNLTKEERNDLIRSYID
jgi:hypothetical protein